MTTALDVTNGRRTSAIRGWDPGYQKLVTSTLLRPDKRDATPAELALFAEVASRSGLDPFARQIFGVFRFDTRAGGEVMTVQVSIDGLRLIADRSGKYQGQTPVQWCDDEGNWVDVWLKAEKPAAARVGVYKQGHREALYGVATWREFAQTKRDGTPTVMWQRMGPHMLAKCAEALALRKAFPAETSGLYTPDEPVEETPAQVPPPTTEEVVSAEPVDDNALAVQITVAEDLGEQLGVEKVLMALVAAGAQDTETIASAVRTTEPESVVATLAGLEDEAKGAAA